MTQIDELDRRITAALDRIAQGIEAMDSAPAPTPSSDPDEVAKLTEALEDERLANAQLEERLKSLRSKEAAEVKSLRAQIAGQGDTLAKLDTELQRLRRANEMLSTTNQDMRRALEANVGEPHLINKAMLAELEGLRAARAADAAENRVVLETLEPLLTQAAASQADSQETV